MVVTLIRHFTSIISTILKLGISSAVAAAYAADVAAAAATTAVVVAAVAATIAEVVPVADGQYAEVTSTVMVTSRSQAR